MTRNPALTVVFALFLVTAMSLGAPDGKASAPQPIPLRVTFEPAMSDSTPCAVCGDGLGDYVDGVDGVNAGFSRYGYFAFYFRGGDASGRSVLFDYSEFYPSANHPAVVPPPPSGPHTYGEFVTFNAFTPYTYLQEMRVGDSPQCLMTGWNLGQGSPVWPNNYHRNGSPFFDALTSYVVAKCVEEASGSCTKWELEPAASACNSGTVPTLVNVVKMTKPKPNKATFEDYGLWKLHFKLTLTRI